MKIISLTQGAGTIGLPAELDEIFMLAGRLREAQLNMRIARRFKAFSIQSYLAYTHSRMEKRKKKLVRTLNAFDIESLLPLNMQVSAAIAKMKEVAFEDMILAEMRNGIEYESDAIKKKKPGSRLHTMRRQISMIRWLATAVGTSAPGGITPEVAEKARDCHNIIGGWHDRKVLERSLHKFLDKKASKGSRKSITGLVKELHVKNRKKALEIAGELKGELDGLRKLIPAPQL